MPILSRVAPDLPEVFRVMTDRYGFVLHFEDEYWLSLRSPHCIIDITFERYGSGFFIVLVNPLDDQDRYDYPFVMVIRHPECFGAMPPHDESLTEERNLLLKLNVLSDNLIRYCPDLLAGNFATIRQEGYYELASYIEARMPVVLNMPAADPIKAKFWRGDLTWAKDLQEREQARLTSTTL